mmetsp:Transcript_9991/g.19768  ORF Transcript_9991/g.19768 Transcript_9991/m.19768 type:complete len:196 (-) Transcript_9991:2323-2910(-)|eukprot:CAMPEP_0204911090 /NCGR_PEP_ID=MMETSP1397-20131031/9499_1 /ASSEMBLY_ACC=CAM_ASM_000891 /TAXON_ID=49980 /ORGANISM="Climacostomum Climacostomum virens, Strain Stock W-24" /LENGTH=195 /DNA_ID=CAMNT_0052081513 /DNA_START=63 /DNA_END=650 /DNA_ORIENTATION=-
MEAKISLRRVLKLRRDRIYDRWMEDPLAYYEALKEFAVPALMKLIPQTAVVVAGFYPIGSEIDCAFVLKELALETHLSVCLPVVSDQGQPLIFRSWDCNPDSLVEAAFKTKVPHPSFPEVQPDFVITPLLGFDSSLMRLGYGGGFYDRTLKALREVKSTPAVGLAFLGQLSESLPFDEQDVGVDAVVTEEGLFVN